MSDEIAITEADFEAALAATRKAAAELDLTNADHVALWLEEHLPDASLGWLACRILDAHEAKMAALQSQVRELKRALEPFAQPPLYVFDEAKRWVPSPQPEGWIGGGWFATADFERARALVELNPDYISSSPRSDKHGRPLRKMPHFGRQSDAPTPSEPTP